MNKLAKLHNRLKEHLDTQTNTIVSHKLLAVLANILFMMHEDTLSEEQMGILCNKIKLAIQNDYELLNNMDSIEEQVVYLCMLTMPENAISLQTQVIDYGLAMLTENLQSSNTDTKHAIFIELDTICYALRKKLLSLPQDSYTTLLIAKIILTNNKLILKKYQKLLNEKDKDIPSLIDRIIDKITKKIKSSSKDLEHKLILSRKLHAINIEQKKATEHGVELNKHELGNLRYYNAKQNTNITLLGPLIGMFVGYFINPHSLFKLAYTVVGGFLGSVIEKELTHNQITSNKADFFNIDEPITQNKQVHAEVEILKNLRQTKEIKDLASKLSISSEDVDTLDTCIKKQDRGIHR